MQESIEQNESNTIEIQVAGVPLKLRSLHDDRTVRELVGLVDEKVKQALASNSNISYQKALLLASLHIAEDLHLSQASGNSALGSIGSKDKNDPIGIERHSSHTHRG